MQYKGDNNVRMDTREEVRYIDIVRILLRTVIELIFKQYNAIFLPTRATYVQPKLLSLHWRCIMRLTSILQGLSVVPCPAAAPCRLGFQRFFLDLALN